jgi:hypothetical protein
MLFERCGVKNRAQFARDNKISANMINQHLKGIRPISLEYANVYSAALGVGIEEVSPSNYMKIKDALNSAINAGLESPPAQAMGEIVTSNTNCITVKLVDMQVFAGVAGFKATNIESESTCAVFTNEWIAKRNLNPSKLHAILVRGVSMETSLYDGDLVVINTDDRRIDDGEVYAVNYEGELVVKRLKREMGNWYLSSDNQDKRRYQDKLFNDNCIIIGRVIHRQTERI